jgi:hypothetical protein
MEVRDAVEADATRLASLTDAPEDVMRNLIHDRTVRVAYDPADEPAAETGGDARGPIRGFVSFDAQAETVHVTQLEGDPGTYDGLLSEPLRFAETENMAVELLVPAGEENLADAARAAGFEPTGSGPRFDGQPTERYRLER